jgi:sugar lactone lactonase YvrE
MRANRVDEFNSSGSWLMSVGGTSSACTNCACTGPSTCPASSGSGNGQLNFPQGIAIDSSNNLWVGDFNNNRVQEFSSSGSYLGQIGCTGTSACSSGSSNGQFNEPGNIVIDSGGHLWVSDTGNSRVEELSTSGSYLGYFGSGGCCGNGQGNFRYGAIGIAIDSSGNFWASDFFNNRVEEFNNSGSYVSQIGCTGTNACSSGTGSGQFYQPYGIAIGR